MADPNTNTTGYVYCISNVSMPGILKIGMTEQEPNARLYDANVSDTWRPPTPYKLEFAKCVNNPKQKEKTLHILLSQYSSRVNPKREFFKVDIATIKPFFDLMDGDMWREFTPEIPKIAKLPPSPEHGNTTESAAVDVKKIVKTLETPKVSVVSGESGLPEIPQTVDVKQIVETIEARTALGNADDVDDADGSGHVGSGKKVIVKCRDTSKYLKNRQQIRHIVDASIWVGYYDTPLNSIVCDGKLFDGRSPLSQFVKAHYKEVRTVVPSRINAWNECECFADGVWISTRGL